MCQNKINQKKLEVVYMNKIEFNVKEEAIMYGFEEVLYRCFKIFQDPNKYSLKEIGNFAQYCFMSERFYRLYQILVKKYPELELQKDVYQLGENLSKHPTLYINDVMADLPSKIGFRNQMEFVLLSPVPLIEEYFRISSGRKRIEAPWINTSEEIDKREEDSATLNRIKRKSTAIMYSQSIRQSLDLLGCELQYLKSNGVSDVYDLAPLYTRKYFEIIFENQEQIRYFIQNFYDLRYKREVRTDKESLLIQKEVLDQAKNNFKENLNLEVLTFFSTINPSYYNFLHYPLNDNLDDMYSRLDFLSGGIYDELSSKDFSYKKLDKSYQLSKNMLS